MTVYVVVRYSVPNCSSVYRSLDDALEEVEGWYGWSCTGIHTDSDPGHFIFDSYGVALGIIIPTYLR